MADTIVNRVAESALITFDLEQFYQIGQRQTVDLSQWLDQGLVLKEKEIEALKLDTIMNNSKFKNKKIDFLNIDIEGGDYEALCSLNFNIYKPKIICVEIDEKNILKSNIYKYLINLNYKKIWSSISNLSHIFSNSED